MSRNMCGIAEARNNGLFCVKFGRLATEMECDNCLTISL